MDYVIVILCFAVFTSMMVFFIYDRYLQWKQKQQLGFMTEMPDYSDCLEASRQLMLFLHDRYWGINVADSCKKAGMDGDYMSLAKSHDVVDLIRYVHLCGCRILMRKISDGSVVDIQHDRLCRCHKRQERNGTDHRKDGDHHSNRAKRQAASVFGLRLFRKSTLHGKCIVRRRRFLDRLRLDWFRLDRFWLGWFSGFRLLGDCRRLRNRCGRCRLL